MLRAHVWYGLNSNRSHNVGEKLANPWGLHDMHGNVWEWCLDSWSGRYPGELVRDFYVKTEGTFKVIRGGSWRYIGRLCRLASRGSDQELTRRNDLGLRIALVSTQLVADPSRRTTPASLISHPRTAPANTIENLLHVFGFDFNFC